MNLYQITEVQKVIKFMKQESTRSFVAPKPENYMKSKKKNWPYNWKR